MKLTRNHAEWLVILLFVGLIAIVFQQISTSMTEQGIASGSPYDNAAAYPRAVALLMGALLLCIVAIGQVVSKSGAPVPSLETSSLRRPVILLLVFAAYLGGLGTLGYHLTTPLLIMAILLISGIRNKWEIVLFGFGVSLFLAFMFEVFLNIVFPGGIFGLNIPW
jgi:putative tricarboxylic transport membrane protein